MWEYFLNGKQVTSDYISERARISNISFEEYIKKNNIQKKSSSKSITEEIKKDKLPKSERSLGVVKKDIISSAPEVKLQKFPEKQLEVNIADEIKKAIYEPESYIGEQQKEKESYTEEYELDVNSKLQDSFDIFEDKNITEEKAVPKLNEKFNDLGFKFYQDRIGDYIKVKATNGNETTIKLKTTGEESPYTISQSPYNLLSNFINENKSLDKKENKVFKEYGISKTDLDSEFDADNILDIGAASSNMVNKILDSPELYNVPIFNIAEYDPSLQADKLSQYSEDIKEAAVRNSQLLSSVNNDIINAVLSPENLQDIFEQRKQEALLKKTISGSYSPESVYKVKLRDIDNLKISPEKSYEAPVIKNYLKIGIEIDELREKYKNSSNEKEKEQIANKLNDLENTKKNIPKQSLGNIEFFNKIPYTKPDGTLASEEERKKTLENSIAEVNTEATFNSKNKNISTREALSNMYNDLVKDQFDRYNWGEKNFIALDLKRGKLNYPEVVEYLFKNNKIDNKYYEGKVELSYNDIIKLKENIFGFRPESQSDLIADADKGKIETYIDYRYYLANKKAALNNVYLKNIAIDEIGETSNLQEFGRSAWRASGLTPTNELEYNSSSVRQAKDNVNSLINDYNITYSNQIEKGEAPALKLNQDEEKALERTFDEALVESGGSFVPMVVELGALNAITGGLGSAVGYTRYLNMLKQGSTGQKALFHTLNLLTEEAKMQTIGLNPGGGASFYAGGVLTSNLSPFKTKFKYLEPIWQKVIKAGPVGAASSEIASLTENAIDAMVNNKDFDNFLEEEYSNPSETLKRMLSNSILFSGMGITHVKKTDLMHTSNKYKAINELQNKINNIYDEAGIDNKPIEITKEKAEANFNKLQENQKRKVQNLEEAKDNLYNLYAFESNYELLNSSTDIGKAHAKKVIEQVINSVPNADKNNPLKVQWVSSKEMANKNAKAEYDTNANTIFLNKESKDIATGLTHEVVHVALANYFKNNKLGAYTFNNNLDKILNAAIGDIKVEDKSLTDFIKEKYNITDLRKSTQKKTFNDEYLAYVAELLVRPEIYNSNVSNSLLKDIKQEIINFAEEKLNYKPKINNGQDLVDFLGRYSSNLALGKDVSKKIQRLAEIDLLGIKPSDAVAQERKASLDIREQIEKLEKQKELLEDSWYDQEIDDYEFNQKTRLADERINKLKEALKEEGIKPLPKKPIEKKSEEGDLNSSIEKLMPSRNKENLYDISRIDWAVEKSDEVATELLKEDGIVESLIRKELRRNGVVTDNVHGLGIEDFIAEVKSKVLKTIQDFNPEVKPKNGESNLLRWIMGKSGIPNRVGDVANKLKKSLKTKDVGPEFNFRIEDEDVNLFETEDLSIGAKPKTEKGEVIIDPIEFFIKDDNVKNNLQEKINNFLKEKEVFTGLTYKTIRQELPSLFESVGKKPSSYESLGVTYFSDTAKSLFGKTEKDIKKFITDNAETIYSLLPKGAMKAPIDKTKSATGIERTILKNFYESGERITMERELTSESGGTYSGLKEQVKIPFNKKIFLETFLGQQGSSLKNSEKRAINALARELETGLKNKLARDYMAENKINVDIINRMADGKSDRMASYVIDYFESFNPSLKNSLKDTEDFKEKQKLFLGWFKDPDNKKYIYNISEQLISSVKAISDGSKQFSSKKQEIDKYLKNALNKEKLSSEDQEKFLNLFYEEIISSQTITKDANGNEVYNIDIEIYKKLIEGYKKLAYYLPPKFPKTLAGGVAGFHQKTNNLGLSRDSILFSEKRIKDKDGNEIKSDNFPENFWAKSKDAWSDLLNIIKRSNKTIPYWKDIDLTNTVFNQTAKNKLKEGGKKSLLNYLNKKGTNGKTRVENTVAFQIALNKTYQQFLNDGKSKTGEITEEYIKRLALIYKIKSAQTDARAGEANFSTIIAYDKKALKEGELNKIEHLKPLNNLLLKEMELFLNNNYNDITAKDLLKDHYGILGNAENFKILDKISNTNSAEAARLLIDPKNIGNYVFIDKKNIKTLLKEALKNNNLSPKEKKEIKEKANELINIIETNEKLAGKFLNKDANLEETINLLENLTKSYEKGIEGDRMASIDFNSEFNKMLERKEGIDKNLIVSAKKAALTGKDKGRFDIFIAPSAEDFMGLMYKLLGKGKQGDADKKFIEDNIYKPYLQGTNALATDRVNTLTDFKTVKKALKIKKSFLNENIADTYFTKEHAVRAYIWSKQGDKIPGLIDSDIALLNSEVLNDTKLKSFAEAISGINRIKYPKPSDHWEGSNIMIDLIDSINSEKRDLYLGRFKKNIDNFLNNDNLNKLEATFGTNYRKALEHSIKRMKTGKNLEISKDAPARLLLNWVRGSQGVTMFLNTRSAVLQLISNINYLNWGDNNPFKAGLAFANQKQYWKDFSKLWNSDYLINRRAGAKLTIEESDIADLASEKGIKGFIAKGLKLGFTPTQMADSFAISTGGATFYRNRINTYLKQGLKPEIAERKAFLDFKASTEESQQSADPARISQQQSSAIGSVILAYANTPAQYARLTKKAILDIKNNRGSFKENIGKIIYYTTVQNLIFSYLQQGLFAAFFDSDEEETDKEGNLTNELKTINSMADSFLRGAGWQGAALSAVKNVGIKLYDEAGKKRPQYSNAAYETLQFAPPIQSKVKLVQSALRTYEYEKEKIEKEGFSYNNPTVLANAKIFTAITNIPLSRVIQKVDNIKASLDNDLETWQRIALIGGYPEWQIAPEIPKTKEEKSAEKKEKRKKELLIWNASSYSEKQKIFLLKKQSKKNDEKKNELEEFKKVLAEKYNIN